MIPVVNHQYRYVLFYSAKAACTHLRELYLGLHRDEMSETEVAHLNGYHNLNEVFPLDWSQDLSGYERFLITRNPFARIVSAFLDQYIYQCADSVASMFDGAKPDSFLSFLEALQAVPEQDRDTHFQSQSFISPERELLTTRNLRYRCLRQVRRNEFLIRHCCDVSRMNVFLTEFYQTLFAQTPSRAERFKRLNRQKTKRNSLLYSNQNIANAATLSVREIDAMVFAPQPESFLADPKVRELVVDIYRKDFKHFGYSSRRVPKTKHFGAKSMLPDGFDWALYIELNPDVANDPVVYNERSAVRHFLEFSPLDDYQRAYNLVAPSDFDWQRYLRLHPDLPAAGIVDYAAALRHYQMFGRREKRQLV